VNQKRQNNRFYSLYTDGASHGNPGESGAGIVLVAPDGSIIVQKSVYLGKKTNNEAEYLALIWGLKTACQHGIKKLYIYMDAQLVVNHLKGIYKVKAENLKALHHEVKELLRQFCYQIYHIKREKNKLADKLANLAIKGS